MIKITIPQKYWDFIPVNERPNVQEWLREVERELYEENIGKTAKMLKEMIENSKGGLK